MEMLTISRLSSPPSPGEFCNEGCFCLTTNTKMKEQTFGPLLYTRVRVKEILPTHLTSNGGLFQIDPCITFSKMLQL